MQTSYCYFDMSVISEKLPLAKGFRFTDRELDILEFVLEMKFSTLEDIHSKFFKVTKWGSTSNSVIWARQRISKLVKSDYLQILTDVCAKHLYVLTQKGFLFLKNSRLSKSYCRPLFEVDGRFFDHDQRVAQLRIALENSGVVKEWISERQLSEFDEVKKYLSAEFRPDAIYMTPEGKKVAFELEIARKSKERYQTKIKRYIQVMSEPQVASSLFDSVHYVCEKEKILDLIKSEVALYQPLFKFSLESEFIK